jgi:hypothetical protein
MSSVPSLSILTSQGSEFVRIDSATFFQEFGAHYKHPDRPVEYTALFADLHRRAIALGASGLETMTPKKPEIGPTLG